MADRYTYVPLVGLAVIAAWGAPELAGRWLSPRWLAVLAGAAVVSLAIPARHQIACWKSGESLDDACGRGDAGQLARTPRSWRRLPRAGEVGRSRHATRGSSRDQARLCDGTSQFRQRLFRDGEVSLRRRTGIPPCHSAQAGRSRSLQQPREAVSRSEKTDKASRLVSAGAPAQTGFRRGALQRRHRAGRDVASARRRLPSTGRRCASSPDFLEPHINLGNALDKAGRFPEAIEQYRKAMAIYARPARWPITISH